MGGYSASNRVSCDMFVQRSVRMLSGMGDVLEWKEEGQRNGAPRLRSSACGGTAAHATCVALRTGGHCDAHPRLLGA